MRIKQYRIICFIIAVLVSISGMCFEDVKADCGFEYAPVEKTNAHIIDGDSAIKDTGICTTEMLRSCNAGVQQHLRAYEGQRRELKGSLYFLCADIISLNEGHLFNGSQICLFCSHNQNKFITNYIHKSDGKKRI